MKATAYTDGACNNRQPPSVRLQRERGDLLAELAACRAKNKELHRRAQKAEGALLKAQPKPVDTWKSRERKQEAIVRDRMMAAVDRAAKQEK